LDGNVATEEQEKSIAICQFYKYLFSNYLDTAKLQEFEGIIKELKKVNFKKDLGIFDDIKFLPMGIGEEYTSLILRKKYKRSFIISPFLSDNIVRTIYANGNDEAERILISREDS